MVREYKHARTSTCSVPEDRMQTGATHNNMSMPASSPRHSLVEAHGRLRWAHVLSLLRGEADQPKDAACEDQRHHHQRDRHILPAGSSGFL